MQQENTIQFNTLFNTLHGVLTDILDTTDKKDFSLCLTEIREKASENILFSRIVEHFYSDLKTINAIRNIIIHRNDWITIPDETIHRIQEMVTAIQNIEKKLETRALDIFWKKVFVCKDSTPLHEVLEAIGERGFAHIPVYSESGKFRWVVSEKSIALWLARQTKSHNSIDFHNTLLKDVVIDTSHHEYIFIPSDCPVSSIEWFFSEYSNNRKKLGAIFLTETGDENEWIDGIITAWDLPRIYSEIE